MSNPIERHLQSTRVGCPFCWEWIPKPEQMIAVFSGDGCLGGRCSCGAGFVIDETGHSGGQALLDAQPGQLRKLLDPNMELRQLR